MDAVPNLGVRIWNTLGLEAAVCRLPGFAAVIGAERTRRRNRDVQPLGVCRVLQDRVQAQTAGAWLPVRPRSVAAQALQLKPVLAAVRGFEHRVVLDAGVDGIRIA